MRKPTLAELMAMGVPEDEARKALKELSSQEAQMVVKALKKIPEH